MPGTRIFVNTYMEGNEFVFTIKNVSEHEIDFTEEEILSRFVRGDKSRNSEGNGLGLSIAKSFTEQCGGSFAVMLDDDMFKIIIKLK
jgi:K+-sensing histidine kinase KdpD